MGKIFFWLSFLLFIACKDQTSVSVKLDEIKESALVTGVKNDTIFLGYTFGMSEVEYYEKTKELLQKGDLQVHEDRSLVSPMNLGMYSTSEEVYARFSPDYYNDKLYKIGVSVKSEEYNYPKLTQSSLLLILMDKYGAWDFEEESIVIDDTKKYYWIQGNRMIELICGIDDARIFYKDISVEAKMKEDGKIKSEEALQKTKTKF